MKPGLSRVKPSPTVVNAGRVDQRKLSGSCRHGVPEPAVLVEALGHELT